MLVTLTSVFVAGIGIWFLSRQLHSFPVLNRLILHAEVGDGSHSATGPTTSVLAAMGPPPRTLSQGDVGVAETDLRPAGRAIFDGRLPDVKSNGGYIEKGTSVRIVSVGRFVIEVEEASA